MKILRENSISMSLLNEKKIQTGFFRFVSNWSARANKLCKVASSCERFWSIVPIRRSASVNCVPSSSSVDRFSLLFDGKEDLRSFWTEFEYVVSIDSTYLQNWSIDSDRLSKNSLDTIVTKSCLWCFDYFSVSNCSEKRST